MKPALDHAVPIHVAPASRRQKFGLYALSPNLLQKAVWFPLRPLFAFFIRFKIEGVEHVRNLPSGAIFASNHSSEFDPIVIPAAMPFWSRHIPFFYVSRGNSSYTHLGWYARAMYGGSFFKLWGAYPVESGSHDYDKALKTHSKFLHDGHSVCVFPEGKMQRSGILAKAHGGVSYLLWKTEKPIIPVGISGIANMNVLDVLLRRRTVTIRFGAPLYKKELFARFGDNPIVNEERNDFTEAAQTVMEKIRSLLVQ